MRCGNGCRYDHWYVRKPNKEEKNHEFLMKRNKSNDVDDYVRHYLY